VPKGKVGILPLGGALSRGCSTLPSPLASKPFPHSPLNSSGAMDALKRELELKRKAFQADFGAAKYVKRSDIERKKLEQIRAEEERQRQRKQELTLQQRHSQQGHDKAAGQGVGAAPSGSQRTQDPTKARGLGAGGAGGAAKGTPDPLGRVGQRGG